MAASTILSRWRSFQHTSWFAPLVAGLVAAVVYASTLQTHINGSYDYYATDVGEIQNALPRWGTLHFTGYPLYSITGSLIVTLLRVVGIPPAAGASLVSLLWGALTIALVARLALELGAGPTAALVGALTLAITTSFWIDASIAEVHTLTMLFTVATLWFAVRFGRGGRRADLLWLAFFLSQGVVHMRAVLFIIPAALVMIAPQWRTALKNLLPVTGICLIAPLLYLYMPLREWMGADWAFGQTSTWQGFWTMVLDTKAERIVNAATSPEEWLERGRIILGLLANDLPLTLQIVGLGGLFALSQPNRLGYWREVVACHLAWLPYAALGLIIWEGRTSDALLAVKLPVPMMAGIGLTLLITRLQSWRPLTGYAAVAASTVGLIILGWLHYPSIIAITRDRSIEATIATAEQAANPDSPLVLMALWGHSYWGLVYAQEYRAQLEGITLVDHNASAEQIIADGYRLITLSETFYERPVSWWADLLGPVYLDTYAPGLIEIRNTPREGNPEADLFFVNDDLAIEFAEALYTNNGDFLVTVHWRALAAHQRDYHIAVHLVSIDPPTGLQDILAQADSLHPVEGWYPISQWAEGQTVQDVYRLAPPPDSQPAAVRITAYFVNETGEFVNGEWLTLPISIPQITGKPLSPIAWPAGAPAS